MVFDLLCYSSERSNTTGIFVGIRHYVHTSNTLMYLSVCCNTCPMGKKKIALKFDMLTLKNWKKKLTHLGHLLPLFLSSSKNPPPPSQKYPKIGFPPPALLGCFSSSLCQLWEITGMLSFFFYLLGLLA